MPPSPGSDPLTDISSHLPLSLLRSHILPPSPTATSAAVDFLDDFGGSSWLAHAAASFLVISHFPDPLSPAQTLVGPSFRQVIPPRHHNHPPTTDDDEEDDVISAVSWCPARPSSGEIATAAGNSVAVYAPRDGTDSGSFCWRQTTVIVQSFKVEAIHWTGSGDSLIAVGINVALWKRQNTSWEIAWTSKAVVPQSLVSATWNAEGLVATGANVSVLDGSDVKANSSTSKESSSCVTIYQSDGNTGVFTIKLCHPEPVTMIRWRPFTATRAIENVLSAQRDVLLTCCLDGTVRLWAEVDTGSRSRKINKEVNGNKIKSPSFHVVAVIEINQHLKGTLGVDIFMDWPVEVGAMISKIDGKTYCLSSDYLEHDQVVKCEWLVGVGPSHSLTFWAIHCLDDVNPLRSPRVTLWAQRDLMDSKFHRLCDSGIPKFEGTPILVKVVSSRSQLHGPPDACSLLQLLPDNSVSWLQVCDPTHNSMENNVSNENSKEKSLSCYAAGVLNQDGHMGTILQLAIHPCCEVELACSLDSNGLLLFWSVPTISSCTLGVQMLNHSAWEILGRVSSQGLSTGVQYFSLRWAPSVLEENLFLLLGYGTGIDCFLIDYPRKGKSILCHKVFTIPFPDHNHVGGSPDQIFVTPLASTCVQSFHYNSFLLFAMWTKKFQALSWKVTLHSADPSGNSCRCGSDTGILAICEKERDVCSFTSRTFYATIDLGSSFSPDPYSSVNIVSFSVVSPDSIVLSSQCAESFNFASNGYHIATGCSDGVLKLWKMSVATSSDLDGKFVPWDLVGMFTAHCGPVSAVSLSSCGSKIATVSKDGENNLNNLHIWESISLLSGGSFLLEDAISLNSDVVALSWLSIGNGQLLLAVCMTNELRIYSEKKSDLYTVRSKELKNAHSWCCISLSQTYPICHGFIWGPKLTPVLVHKQHFSVYSQWLAIAEHKCSPDDVATYVERRAENVPFAVCIGNDMSNKRESLSNNICRKMVYEQYTPIAAESVHNLSVVADRLYGTLVAYHPTALIQHLYSGNWKHANAILNYLIGAIKSREASTTVQESSKYKKSRYFIPEFKFPTYSDGNPSKESCNKGFQWGQYTASGTSGLMSQNNAFHFVDSMSQVNAPDDIHSTTQKEESNIKSSVEILERSFMIKAFSNIEKTQTLALVDLLAKLSETSCSTAYENLDKPGRRFWVDVQFQHLYIIRISGISAATANFVADSRMFTWAFQSECQDNLLNSLLSAEPSWPEMRNLGVGFWFTNASQLRTRMEKLARAQYLKKKDPKDCALLYLALNRLQVLTGLFKISRDEKDKPLVGFLLRNFQEEKHKAAALKNAYVLMGRHQLDLAIAFFLLGGDPSSAVTVCAKNLGDEQLALIICRLVEGHGGQLERKLIINVLLPNAIEKEDYWLACLLEWTLGNYTSSIRKLLDSQLCSAVGAPAMCNLAAFVDPDIGQYCSLIAAKNNMKNSIGDYPAMVLSRLATVMSVFAFDRCGIPLEALERLSSSNSIEVYSAENLLDLGSHEIFCRILNPFSTNLRNWLLADVSNHLDFSAKLRLAMKYISKLLTTHTSWHLTDFSAYEKLIPDEYDSYKDVQETAECKKNLDVVISVFGKKYLLQSGDLTNMILVLAYNKGLFFHSHRLLRCETSQEHEADYQSVRNPMLNSFLSRLLLKAIENITCILSRHVVSCSLTDSTLKLLCAGSSIAPKDSSDQLPNRTLCLQSLISEVRTIKPLLEHSDCSACDLTLRTISVLDLLEYCAQFALTWFNRNVNMMILTIQTITDVPTDDLSSLDSIIHKLMKSLHQTSDHPANDASGHRIGAALDVNGEHRQLEQCDLSTLLVPEDEMLQLIGTSLWMHLSVFVERQMNHFLALKQMENGSATSLINFPVDAAKSLITLVTYISSSITRQLGSFLRYKASKGLPVAYLAWLHGSSHQHSNSLHDHLNQGIDMSQQVTEEDKESLPNKLWEISVKPEKICDSFVTERILCFPYNSQKVSGSWKDVMEVYCTEYTNGSSSTDKVESTNESKSSVNEARSPLRNRARVTDGILETKRKSLGLRRDLTFFHGPREVLKRKGELLEAICFNSVDEQQVAVASNRKGILFFNWTSDNYHFKKEAEYMWSESDWPQDGWAGCESTPVPTYVSQGIGLGSKRGSHLGLGGATVGLGSLAKPGRDVTGGGAFGIPGYAGIGASGLGWGEQDDFEELVDTPATTANISSRTLSSHPSRPLFLAGSSNTHIYLWEFGKERATATYGVLPAANVPPPYALASISSLQFDYSGHRFATAALDGTVCTWQLEVGGRSNVHPTDSSFCFNNHASVVAYVAASGSILAAAGCSSNGVNVVLWDTLAPPVTSQASLVCHEGGARSLSVFDNDIGTGSISPLIVTGGEGGDVGLHDFRYIATGKTKRHRTSSQDLKSSATHDNGMLWYIPKAHLGSVTKISTIPNTSLFLTGSKDGDVKLWDAKRSQLVFHWQKIHDRHTFLQPNSRSIGGVVRAAVTDIQVLSHGFLTCGGDGSAKLIELKR